jgi:hypothetical protein
MSRGGYIVVGIIMALILVPSGIAAALTFNGLEGTNGVTTTLYGAHITSAGQLLTTVASPIRSWLVSAEFSGPAFLNLPTPPTGYFAVITELQIDTFSDPSPGPGSFVTVEDNASVVNHNVSTLELADVNPASVGEVVIPFSPGQSTINGGSGAGASFLQLDVQGISVTLTASGYFSPCSDGLGVCT